MAHKDKGAHKKDKTEWQEDVLQAVVLADSFNQRFSPLTACEPRTLLPLLNTTLLDYTLEFLTAAGVQEIVLFLCAFSDKIKQHIAKSKWSKIVTSITSEKCVSLGDAMREIDRTGLIRNNFVMVSGDMVSNYKLGILEDFKCADSHALAHARRARVKADKDVVMTMIMKRANPGHPLRSAEDNLVVALEKPSGRLLSYDNTPEKLPSSDEVPEKKVAVPLSIFEERPTVQIRYDLVDCHIALCSPQVPVLFADNFDYQDMNDFVKGVLDADEINVFIDSSQLETKKIYTHILTTEYAARVGNIFSYQAISKDILRRWTYPLVPDIFAGCGNTVRYKRNHVYLEDTVILSRSCELGPDVMIGANTKVGRDGAATTIIRSSVIGRNCVIGARCPSPANSAGAGVKLIDAYVWDGTVIEDNCIVTKSILAAKVYLGAKASVTGGSLIGHGVSIHAGEEVIGQRLAQVPPPDEFDGPAAKTSKGYYEWPLEKSDPDYLFKLWDLPAAKEEEEDTETESEDEEDNKGVLVTRDGYMEHLEEILDRLRANVRVGEPVSATALHGMLITFRASKLG